jgi:hypothetical protein
MGVRVEEVGRSEGRAVTAWIRAVARLRKEADVRQVLYGEKVWRLNVAYRTG